MSERSTSLRDRMAEPLSREAHDRLWQQVSARRSRAHTTGRWAAWVGRGLAVMVLVGAAGSLLRAPVARLAGMGSPVATVDGRDPGPVRASFSDPAENEASVVQARLPLATWRVVQVGSEPAGARVTDGDDVEVCKATPCRVTWAQDASDTGYWLTLSKPGYRPLSMLVEPGEEERVGKLERARAKESHPGSDPEPQTDPESRHRLGLSQVPLFSNAQSAGLWDPAPEPKPDAEPRRALPTFTEPGL